MESEVLADQRFLLEAFSPYLKTKIGTPELCKALSFRLCSFKVFTEDQKDQVHRGNDEIAVQKFFEFFFQVCNHSDCYKIFCGTLEDLGYGYVIDTLEGKCIEKSVTLNLWENALEKNFIDLITNFDSTGVLIFYGKELFDDLSLQTIKAQRTLIGKNEMFFYCLTKKPNWFPNLLNALSDYRLGDLSHFKRMLDPLDNGQYSCFINLIEAFLPKIRETLQVEDVLENMDFPDQSKQYIKSTKPESQVDTFINVMTSQNSKWFKSFIIALSVCGEKYHELINLLDPDEDNVSGANNNESEQEATGSYYETSSFKDDKAVPDSFPTERQPLQEVGPVTSPADDSDLNIQEPEKHENEGLEKHVSDKETETLQLRDYQLELAKPALKGDNCMIVAPTGCGKTYVALKVCMDHIKKIKDAKVIFLVPRVPLVKQQFNLFKKFIKNDHKLFQITGDSSSTVPVHISIQQHVLTFMTAQILVNLISDGLMQISDISLLIFDECHHTVKGEPYNQIMGLYSDKQLEKGSKLPQIVGLTASPGMGKAKTMVRAHQNIKSLMANLDVTTAPVQVIEEKKNLKMFQNVTVDEIIAVSRRVEDPFIVKVKRAMKIIEDKIRSGISSYENVLEKRIEFDLRAAQGTQDYEAWAVTLLNKSKLIKNDTASQYFMCCAQHLNVYNSSLMLNDHVRSCDAEEYLKDVLFKSSPKIEIEQEMADVYPFHDPDPLLVESTNPLLLRLKQKLCDEFNENPTSRCIIFVKTRDIVRGLLSYLSQDQTLEKYKLNPKQLTGAGARRDNFGMTKVGQDDNLNAFREGKCKVLVATSVAEEGLDIKECNLIITYNYSTNEVGKVQRRGRGRAENSKVIMLAYDDSGHVKRERENQIREKLTQEILEALTKLTPNKLEASIREIQAKLRKEREVERVVQDVKSRKKKPSKTIFKLKCLWCKKLATTSDNFYHINNQHRVVVDKEFKSRALFKEVPESEARQIGDQEFVIGKIFCKNERCGREWGLRMRYKKCPISVLRIENFLIINNNYRAVKKKWKEAPFTVDKELDGPVLRTIWDGPNDVNNDVIEDDPNLGNNLNI